MAICLFIIQVPIMATVPSSYQRSCTRISINGNVLHATCKTIDGHNRNSSITLRGISNQNGVLTEDNACIDSNTGVSSFQLSCSDIHIENKTILVASCKRIDGSINTTSIHISGIENMDGILTYEICH